MDFLSLLLQPNGFWQNIILGLENIVKDYGLTLILITLIIKFVMLPLDLLNKYITKNNARKQAKLKPQLDKIQKTYSNNPQMLNQKTIELYKRENYSVVGTCLGMLLNMIITMVVFFTLLGALNNIATYKQFNEFTTLQQTYYEAIEEQGYSLQNLSETEINELILSLPQDVVQNANQAVVNKYGEIKSGFLWIKNIWKPDTTTSAILSYNEFKKVQEKNTVSEQTYNIVIDPVKEVYGGPNGYFILTILSALTTYLSMQIITVISKLKAQKQGKEFIDPTGGNKILVYLMPIIMAIFTFFYTAAFGLYIVAGSIFNLITGPFVTMLADYLDSISEKKEKAKVTVSYSRK